LTLAPKNDSKIRGTALARSIYHACIAIHLTKVEISLFQYPTIVKMAEIDEFPPEVIDEFLDTKSELTDEQKKRIEENKRKALELKRKRQESRAAVQ